MSISTKSGKNPTLINWCLLVPFLLILIYLELLPLLRAGGPAPPTEIFTGMTPADRGAYFGFLFSQLPGWVTVWMHFQDAIIFASVFFLFWYRAVRWYIGGVIANHIVLFALMPAIPLKSLSLDFAAFTHFFWIPALIVFIRAWTKIEKNTPFGIWMSVAILQMCISLTFDTPAGLRWIISLFG